METSVARKRAVWRGGCLVWLLSEQTLSETFKACALLGRYWDVGQEREFTFLTHAFHLSSLQVAELYRNRWQVELFFKWLKQHLKIKKFWGTTENAVRIQIYSAICAYCLVAIVQHDMQLTRSTYEVLQILGVSLTDKTPLYDLFNNNQLNDFKELNNSSGQLLLNF